MIALIMAAILNTTGGIDSEKAGLRFIEPIRKVIVDQSRKVLVEKSIRVGMTYGEAFASDRDSLETRKLDTLFTTKDQFTAFEFIENCHEHLEIFNHTRSIISRGVEEWSIPVFNEDGRDTGVVEKLNVAKILFDNKSRILAFSSNPNALLAYGGNVKWDEAAFSPHGRRMWSAIQGRARWGGKIHVWSSLAMEDTTFDLLAEEAKKPDSTWSHYHIDIHEAIAAGLVELINEARGTRFTREEFLQDCKDDAVFPELFALNYEIRKENTLASIVDWVTLKACERPYSIERAHLDHADVARLFGAAHLEDPGTRRRNLETWMRAHFPNLFSSRQAGKRFRLGFDVAASRKGDLACVYIDEKTGDGLTCRAVLTFRTEDWDIIEWANAIFMSSLPGEVKGAGDETGLGRQVCWHLSKLFYGRFQGVNFGTLKTDLGVNLMGELASQSKIIPNDQPEITQDFYSIKKGVRRERVYFFESRNSLLPASHSDIGWAGALASWADRVGTAEYWGGTVG